MRNAEIGITEKSAPAPQEPIRRAASIAQELEQPMAKRAKTCEEPPSSSSATVSELGGEEDFEMVDKNPVATATPASFRRTPTSTRGSTPASSSHPWKKLETVVITKTIDAAGNVVSEDREKQFKLTFALKGKGFENKG